MLLVAAVLRSNSGASKSNHGERTRSPNDVPWAPLCLLPSLLSPVWHKLCCWCVLWMFYERITTWRSTTTTSSSTTTAARTTFLHLVWANFRPSSSLMNLSQKAIKKSPALPYKCICMHNSDMHIVSGWGPAFFLLLYVKRNWTWLPSSRYDFNAAVKKKEEEAES